MEFDVIVIGSGAGGAPIAHTLVNAGKNVLLIEKGPLLDTQNKNVPSPFLRDELLAYGEENIINIDGVDNNGKNYFSSHIEPDINAEPHVYLNKNNQDLATIEGYTAQAVGGGTQLYGGVSLRFTELDFNLRSFNESRILKNDPAGDVKREARDWPVSYATFKHYYNIAEEKIGINGTRKGQLKDFSNQADVYHQPLTPNPISEFAKRGMQKLGEKYQYKNTPVVPYRPPLAVITEPHTSSGRTPPTDKESIKTGYVNRYGDPLGLKSNTWVSLLKPIHKNENFTLLSNCTVIKLSTDGDKVNKVHYLLPDGSATSASAKIIVVACSAIESVRLLKISALDDANFNRRINQNDLLGKYFLTNCFGGANGFTSERYDKSKSLDADWAIDCCATEDFINQFDLWAGGAIYNNTSDRALPLSLFRTMGSQDLDTLWDSFENNTKLVNSQLIDYLNENYGRNLSISFMANQVPQKTNRIELHSKVKDKWGLPSAYIIKNWHNHDQYMMRTLADRCREILENGGTAKKPITNINAGGVSDSVNPRARIANHVMGGARFGLERNDSVLDKNCRAWDFDNLYVTDGSFMPTSGSANPTLTIQANAFRVADIILGRL